MAVAVSGSLDSGVLVAIELAEELDFESDVFGSDGAFHVADEL